MQEQIFSPTKQPSQQHPMADIMANQDQALTQIYGERARTSLSLVSDIKTACIASAVKSHKKQFKGDFVPEKTFFQQLSPFCMFRVSQHKILWRLKPDCQHDQLNVFWVLLFWGDDWLLASQTFQFKLLWEVCLLSKRFWWTSDLLYTVFILIRWSVFHVVYNSFCHHSSDLAAKFV